MYEPGTGTPVENRLADLWSILEFTNPGMLGSGGGVQEALCRTDRATRDDEVAERLRRFTAPFILRRVKTDSSIIFDLPEKLEMDVLCNLTAEQAGLYQAVVDDMLRRIEKSDGIERRGLVLATMTKLKQVCNHPAHFLRDGSGLSGRSGKLERLEEIIEENPRGRGEGPAVHPVRRIRLDAARPPWRAIRPRGALSARRSRQAGAGRHGVAVPVERISRSAVYSHSP
jgi:SNF2 family DNA or RNA helicase